MKLTKEDVRFIHFREMNEKGQVEGRGGATLCYKREGKKLKVSWTVCSLKDNFCKKIGRSISIGRLNDGCYIDIDGVEDTPYERMKSWFCNLIKISSHDEYYINNDMSVIRGYFEGYSLRKELIF